MLPKIDLELDAFLNLDESLPFATAEVSDAVEQFIETAKLAGQVGWQTTDGFSAETSRIEKHTAGILKHAAPSPADPDTPLTEDRLLRKFTTKPQAAFTKISPNGKWELCYNAQNELIGGHERADT